MFVLASAAALILTACGPDKPVPVTNLGPFKPLHPRCADTAESRTEMNEHNSVYDSLKKGKRVIYSDHCPKEKPEPKTS